MGDSIPAAGELNKNEISEKNKYQPLPKKLLFDVNKYDAFTNNFEASVSDDTYKSDNDRMRGLTRAQGMGVSLSENDLTVSLTSLVLTFFISFFVGVGLTLAMMLG